ncbi:TM2 domain-containing protein [Undibacterium aquatile]|uniref:TM2 domain-containing protein n=1 Tax=Undibacterium aquatile TaxID=1537398 RepID=A0ABR6XEM4_9BURK|nr:TM2 domain-containing protein [Undibacterium aquatile]MBC3811355.1 TM2 domain-containing protein [Undibacterium aquatile]
MIREKKLDEKFCADCGEIIKLKAEICPKCGCRQSPVPPATFGISINSPGMKSRTTAGVLALFLGGIGMHKFYLDKPMQGIAYLFFCWTFIPALLAFIEAIRYFSMTDDEFASRLASGKLDHVGKVDLSPAGVTPDTHVKCPDCRALIPKEAKVCQYCRCSLIPQ